MLCQGGKNIFRQMKVVNYLFIIVILIKLKGFALVVPGGDNPMGGTVPGIKPAQPRISYADMGFKKNPDGTWAVEVDTMGLPREIRDIEASLQDEVARMKVRALAASRGYQIVNEERAGDQTYIDMIVPVEEQYRLQG